MRATILERERERLGLADASLALVAERYATRRLLTFDEHAFRAVTPLQRGVSTLLPADQAG